MLLLLLLSRLRYFLLFLFVFDRYFYFPAQLAGGVLTVSILNELLKVSTAVHASYRHVDAARVNQPCRRWLFECMNEILTKDICHN